jgi:hypothetical protein
MMSKKNRSSIYGKDKAYILSDEVDLQGEVYQRAHMASKSCEIHDHFINPGPIQFFGEGKDRVNKTVYLKSKKYSEQVSIIKDLCNLIQRKTTFADDQGILKAAIASLKGVEETL